MAPGTICTPSAPPSLQRPPTLCVTLALAAQHASPSHAPLSCHLTGPHPARLGHVLGALDLPTAHPGPLQRRPLHACPAGTPRAGSAAEFARSGADRRQLHGSAAPSRCEGVGSGAGLCPAWWPHCELGGRQRRSGHASSQHRQWRAVQVVWCDRTRVHNSRCSACHAPVAGIVAA